MNNFEEIYSFDHLPGKWVVSSDSRLIDELVSLYSNHYGKWSSNSPDPSMKGKRIRLSAEKLKQWLNNDIAEVWIVRHNVELVGYAVVLRGKSGSKEKIIWVTQFVIHENHRNKGVGKALLFRVWGFSSFFAWGLLTANPYAIRALEKATRRRCEPSRIKKNMQQLLNFGVENIHYVKAVENMDISNDSSRLDTRFYVDHSDIGERLNKITSEEKPWLLGELEEGWEWFAFTFSDQLPIELSQMEIEFMLKASDKMAKEAYTRMPMNDDNHKWASHTKDEVDYIISHCKLHGNSKIIDIGCGMGRHSIELSRKGFNVLGIDYAQELIDVANKKAMQESLNVEFKIHDVVDNSTEEFFEPFSYDCALCLYDVIGSYTDNEKNDVIVSRISSSLKKGGMAIISVMNLYSTEQNAKNKFEINNSTKELLALAVSNIMEGSGNVFNPDYYLVDTQTKIVYRKEVFNNSNRYPIELIVRDRRFYMNDIIKMCETFGLRIIEKRFVNAGWSKDLDESVAKEILLVCEKL